MKVRGKRNRERTARRTETRVEIPAAALVHRNARGEYTFTAHDPGTVPVGVTTHRIIASQWHDGWGRRVSAPRPQPKPPMAREGMYSFSFQTNARTTSDDLWAVLTGRPAL
jgi:hypothetical protein